MKSHYEQLIIEMIKWFIQATKVNYQFLSILYIYK